MSATDLPGGVTEDAAVQYLSSKVDANLGHLVQESGVPIGLQYKICQQFKTVRTCASYEDDRSKVREAMKTDFSLDGCRKFGRTLSIGGSSQHLGGMPALRREGSRVESRGPRAGHTTSGGPH